MNLATFVVAALVFIPVIAIAVRSLKRAKNGQGSCECGCSACGMKDKCHPDNK